MSEYATIEHYVNHVMGEITKRDVEHVSERLRAFGWEEVVRCRDCVYRGWSDAGGHFCARGIGLTVKPDDFCAWGERREKSE